MATHNRASRHSLQNQTVGIKAWVRTIEYLQNQQTQSTSTVTFAIGTFRNSTSSQIQRDRHKEDLCLGSGKIRGPPPLFMPIEQPPRDPPETCKLPLQTLPTTQRARPAGEGYDNEVSILRRNRPNAQRRSRSGGGGHTDRDLGSPPPPPVGPASSLHPWCHREEISASTSTRGAALDAARR
jgi:hypothetical protein